MSRDNRVFTAPPPRCASIPPPPRVILLADLHDADGEMRAALLIAGRRLPTMFPTIADAVAAARWGAQG